MSCNIRNVRDFGGFSKREFRKYTQRRERRGAVRDIVRQRAEPLCACSGDCYDCEIVFCFEPMWYDE